jgi:hypothetical protein
MQNNPQTIQTYHSIPHISQKLLKTFPQAYIAICCCRRERLVPVSALLEEFGHLKVADAIERLADRACPSCNQTADTVYLQSNIRRTRGSRKEHHGWYAEILP